MNKREEIYHMTAKEMARVKVAERLIEGEIKIGQAADIPMLSTRQVTRIKKGVRLSGPKAVIHGNRARKPKNAVEDKIKDLVVELKRTKYPGTNFSHFKELLEEKEKISLSQPTVHRILRDAGMASPKRKKKMRLHRYRKRMDCPGMMVQLDDSPYKWLGDQKLTLHGAIDDASGNILGLCLDREECLEGYFEVAIQMIAGSGIPISVYSDRHTIFFSPKGRLSVEDQLEGKIEPYTQFSRAMSELGVRMIPAGSPQAKGRIERLWGTLQDRLAQEFSINGIKDVEAANIFAKKYIEKYNRRFSVIPKGDTAFRKPGRKANISYILCRKYSRKLDGGSAFSYKGCYYQLLSGGKIASAIPRSRVRVMIGKRIGIKAEYSGKVYPVARLETRPKAADRIKVKKKRVYKRIAGSHPWKSGYSASLGVDRTDSKTMEGLFSSTLAWNPDNQ